MFNDLFLNLTAQNIVKTGIVNETRACYS